MENNKKVYGVFMTKTEAEDAVRKLMDLGFSTDEIILEENDNEVTVFINSEREILDPTQVEEFDSLDDKVKDSKIMERVERFNKIKHADKLDSRNITSSVIKKENPEADSMFDEHGVLKDSFKEDANNPKLNRLDAESYPYDRKVMSVSTEGDFSQKRYEPKELQKTKFRDGEFVTDEPENKE